MKIQLVLSATVACLAIGVSACGSDDNADSASPSGGSGSAKAGGEFEKAVAEASKPISTWPGPNKGVTPAKGKKIVVITCSPQGAGCVRAAKGATAAGQKLRWKVRTITGNGTPQSWNAGILNAISQKADGIVLDAVPPALVGDAVAKARAAKIPLVSIFNPKVGASEGVFSYVTPDHGAQGVAMANWVAADSKGKAKVILVEDNEFPELVERVKGFQSQLGKCSGCKVVATVSSQIGTMAQKLPGAVTSALQSHSDATYVISQYDSNAFFAGQGVRQAGKTSSVKVGGYEGDPQALAAIKKGDIQAVTVGDPAEWMGWQAIDEFSRAFASKPPANVPTQWRLFTKANTPDGAWDGDLDYQAKFRALWGAS
jgi:ribose transport system substrate-binding protein